MTKKNHFDVDNSLNQPLYVAVSDRIRALIEDQTFPPNTQLPAEVELAQLLNVSRVTLREGLRHLEEDGLITRKHGVGTFVNDLSVRLVTPLEQNLGLTEAITAGGFQPGIEGLSVHYGEADNNISNKLSLSDTRRVVFVERVRTANEIPFVFTLDAIPTTLLPSDFELNQIGSSLYTFLENKCGQQLVYGDARIEAVKADANLSARLQVPINSVLLLLEQIDFNDNGQPILFTREFYVKHMVEFTIRRTRTTSNAEHP